MGKRNQSVKAMESACAKWNTSHAVGTPVEYWPGIMDESLPPRSGSTASEARVLGGHTPGIYIEPGGFVALDHIRVKPSEAESFSMFPEGTTPDQRAAALGLSRA